MNQRKWRIVDWRTNRSIRSREPTGLYVIVNCDAKLLKLLKKNMWVLRAIGTAVWQTEEAHSLGQSIVRWRWQFFLNVGRCVSAAGLGLGLIFALK